MPIFLLDSCRLRKNQKESFDLLNLSGFIVFASDCLAGLPFIGQEDFSYIRILLYCQPCF